LTTVLNHLKMNKLQNIERIEYQSDKDLTPFAKVEIYAIGVADIE